LILGLNLLDVFVFSGSLMRIFSNKAKELYAYFCSPTGQKKPKNKTQTQTPSSTPVKHRQILYRIIPNLRVNEKTRSATLLFGVEAQKIKILNRKQYFSLDQIHEKIPILVHLRKQLEVLTQYSGNRNTPPKLTQ